MRRVAKVVLLALVALPLGASPAAAAPGPDFSQGSGGLGGVVEGGETLGSALE